MEQRFTSRYALSATYFNNLFRNKIDRSILINGNSADYGRTMNVIVSRSGKRLGSHQFID